METIISSSVELAKSFLSNGEVVAIPTETVYGLAANALNKQAVMEIFSAKQRPSFDPLIVHIGHQSDVEKYVQRIPKTAAILMNAFWPGPLTLVLDKKPIIPDEVTSGLNTVGIRMPNHSLALRLLQNLDFPLAAPSANPFGYISPTTPMHVYDQLQHKIPMILDGGSCDVGVESTIVGFEGEMPVVYRLGGLTLEDIRKVCGDIKVDVNTSSNPKAPGMLKSHYAPQKPLYLLNKGNRNFSSDNSTAIIVFGNYLPIGNERVYNLSATSNYKEAASNLFSFLRVLDADTSIKSIYAFLLPEADLGLAINDRIKRASFKEQ
ncbi:MAG: L-threonylcarbamoyladenylate synthase [Bacteroidota bacterium]